MIPTSPSPTPAEKVTQALIAYYRQADSFALTGEEQMEWYSSLSSPAKRDALQLGPFCWSTLPAFRRYALARRGYCLAAFLSLHLTPDELTYWRDHEASLAPVE